MTDINYIVFEHYKQINESTKEDILSNIYYNTHMIMQYSYDLKYVYYGEEMVIKINETLKPCAIYGVIGAIEEALSTLSKEIHIDQYEKCDWKILHITFIK